MIEPFTTADEALLDCKRHDRPTLADVQPSNRSIVIPAPYCQDMREEDEAVLAFFFVKQLLSARVLGKPMTHQAPIAPMGPTGSYQHCTTSAGTRDGVELVSV